MNKEEFTHEGNISKSYRNKAILKTTIILVLFFIIPSLITTIILALIFIPSLIFLLVMFIGVVPYTVIIFIEGFYASAYVRNFSYKFTEEHIVINHGVLTKTRATIPFSRIQNINIVHGVFDRMFKTYTVKIETAGSSAAAQAQAGLRPEGYIPGLKDPHIIEKTIKKMMTKYSQIPSGLEDKIFKPEELAFDNFISYVLSKMREGEKLQTSIKDLIVKSNMSEAKLAEQVGVPIQTINYLIEGRYNPSLSLAYKIAKVFNCKIEDLFKLA